MGDGVSDVSRPQTPSNEPAKKMYTLSKEELVRVIKKEVDKVKQDLVKVQAQNEEISKRELAALDRITELSALNETLSRNVEELKGKQDFLNEVVSLQDENATSSGTDVILRAKVSELESDLEKLRLENVNHVREINEQGNDLAEARTLIEELRSQLDDSQSALGAMKEKHTTVDVFSLEIKDYERKLSILTKQMKDVSEELQSSKNANEELEATVSQLRLSESQAQNEKTESRTETEQIRKELYEEKVRVGELRGEMSKLQERLDSLLEDRGSERMGLGKEMAMLQQRNATLEEAVEALRDEAARLRTDRDAADVRAEGLTKDYESFKSRARFVLEQKAKTEESDVKQEELEKAVHTIAELENSLEELRCQLKTVQEDALRAREQYDRSYVENRSNRRDAEESQIALATTLDELRASRSDIEHILTENKGLRTSLSSTETRVNDLLAAKERVDGQLSEERRTVDKLQKKVDELSDQVSEEKRRREEVVSQLDETRRERVRPPPVAAVFPQFSEREYSSEPRAHSVLSKMSSTTMVEDEALPQQERTLEDVLYGEEFGAHSGSLNGEDWPTGVAETSVEDLVKELDQLRKHAQHMRELLHETEAANQRLVEQSGLLKEEIRRIERNNERTSHLENTEYLKNVIVKFLTPERVAAEKAQLIPILNTMLRLSTEELAVLHRAADSSPSTAPGTGNWGTYLRWGGLS